VCLVYFAKERSLFLELTFYKMTQPSSITPIRISSLALAGVLLGTLALLAVRAHAEEESPRPPLRAQAGATTTNPVREKVMNFKEKRSGLQEEQKKEWGALKDTLRGEMKAFRATSSTSTPEERRVMRERIHTTLTETRDANIAERQALRATYVEELHKTIEARRAELEMKKAERKAHASTTRAEHRASTSAEKLARVSATLNAVVVRMTNSVTHLGVVLDALEKRINTLENAGASLAKAKDSLATTRTSLEKATSDIATFKTLVTDTLTSSNPKEDMADVHTSAQLVRDDLDAVRAGVWNTTDLIRLASTTNSQ
jgi:vacuolar-type H+-ATPase subunit I/STV1